MRIVYLFKITFVYDESLGGGYGGKRFEHSFYSKSPNVKNIRAVANGYMKRHFIPARIVSIGESEMKLQIRCR